MSFVYFIKVGAYVKVGFSYRPEQRMQSILSKNLICPDDLDRQATRQLLASLDGCIMKDERRMHARLAKHRAEGEWFRDSDAFRVAMVDALANYETVGEERLRLRRERIEAKRLKAAA